MSDVGSLCPNVWIHNFPFANTNVIYFSHNFSWGAFSIHPPPPQCPPILSIAFTQLKYDYVQWLSFCYIVCPQCHFSVLYIYIYIYTQRTHDEIITSLWRRNDVATSFWRHNDVIIASCARWVYIYIIISQNIRYLLWNRWAWRSLNNTYPIFVTPCIRCTNHLCDSCDLTDVNPHFIPSGLRLIKNVYLLWRHRYVASNCDVTMTDSSRVVAMDSFLTQWCWWQWFNEFVMTRPYVPSFSTLWKKSMNPWNLWQVTSWWTGKGLCARHEMIMVLIKLKKLIGREPGL